MSPARSRHCKEGAAFDNHCEIIRGKADVVMIAKPGDLHEGAFIDGVSI